MNELISNSNNRVTNTTSNSMNQLLRLARNSKNLKYRLMYNSQNYCTNFLKWSTANAYNSNSSNNYSITNYKKSILVATKQLKF